MLRITCLALTIAICSAPALGAQTLTPSIAAGIAVPTAGLGTSRTLGPLLRGSLLVGAPDRRVRFRGDIEAAWMPATAQPAAPVSSSTGDLRVISVLADLVIGPRGNDSVQPYLLLGLGAQSMRVSGVTNPYGKVPGLRGGVGLRGHVGRFGMSAEITPDLILSDFATGRDFRLGTYWPVSVGISF